VSEGWAWSGEWKKRKNLNGGAGGCNPMWNFREWMPPFGEFLLRSEIFTVFRIERVALLLLKKVLMMGEDCQSCSFGFW